MEGVGWQDTSGKEACHEPRGFEGKSDLLLPTQPTHYSIDDQIRG